MKKMIFLLCALLLLAAGCAPGGTDPASAPEKPTAVLRLQPAGDGTTDDAPALQKACDELPAGGALLIAPGQYRIAQSVTLAEGRMYVFERGAVFTMEEGAVLTLAGTVDAPAETVLDGAVAGHIPQAYVQWFGPAGQVGQDQSEAFQRAIDVADTVLVPGGDYKYSATDLRIAKPTVIRGDGQTQVPIQNKSEKPLFTVASDNVTLDNLDITQSRRGTEPTVLLDASADRTGLLLQDLTIRSPYVGVADAGNGALRGLTMNNVAVYSAKELGVHMTRIRENALLDHVAVYLATDHPAFLFEGCTGMTMRDCDTNSGYSPSMASTGHCFVFEHCADVTLDRLMVDYNNGNAFVFRDCSRMQASSLCASIIRRRLFVFENVSDSVFAQVRAINAGGTPDGDLGCVVTLTGCADLTMDNWTVQDMSTDGVSMAECHGIVWNNLLFGNVRGSVLYEEGDGCDGNTVNGLMAYGNSGRIVQTGPGSRILGLTLRDGTVLAEVAGPYGR